MHQFINQELRSVTITELSGINPLSNGNATHTTIANTPFPNKARLSFFKREHFSMKFRIVSEFGNLSSKAYADLDSPTPLRRESQ